MAIRDAINQNKGLAVGVASVIVLATLVWIGFGMFSSPKAAAPPVKGAFYTEDDAKTYFADAYEKLAAPFNGPNGNPALRAFVCQYMNEKPFVGWIEKYTPRGQQMLAKYYADPANKLAPPPYELQMETLVKRPGAKEWVSMKTDLARATQVKTYSKDNQTPMIIAPE